MMKHDIFTQRTLMPARRAASTLPPMAYTARPQPVREISRCRPTTVTMITRTAHGTPWSSRTAPAKARFWLRRYVAMPQPAPMMIALTTIEPSGSALSPAFRRELVRRSASAR